MEFGSHVKMGEPRRALCEWKLLDGFLDPKAAFQELCSLMGVIGLISYGDALLPPNSLQFKQNRRLLGLLWI